MERGISSSETEEIWDVDVEFDTERKGVEGISSLPRPLDPSAIVRFNRSFLIWIATCFRKFAAVFVSLWQNPHTDSHFAIRSTPVVFHGG